MGWSDDMVNGFLLASILKGEKKPGEMLNGLCPSQRKKILSAFENYTNASLDKRAKTIHHIASKLSQVPKPSGDIHPRIRALLAMKIQDPQLKNQYLQGAPSPRHGFRADPDLVRDLRRLLNQSCVTNEEQIETQARLIDAGCTP